MPTRSAVVAAAAADAGDLRASERYANTAPTLSRGIPSGFAGEYPSLPSMDPEAAPHLESRNPCPFIVIVD